MAGFFSLFFGKNTNNANNVSNANKVALQEKQKLQKILEDILRASVARKLGYGVTFTTNEAEDAFFRELIKQTMEAKLSPYNFDFEPMGSKAFNVLYDRYYIGKIKLNNEYTYMQILKGLHTIKNIEDLKPEEYLAYIPAWVKYIKYCLRN